MKIPIKLNRTYWPKVINSYLPSADSPMVLLNHEVDSEEFSKAISVFKFGTTFKTTKKRRYPITISEIVSIKYPSPPIILDIGASDGITSLDLMQAINFSKFYVTDLNIEISYKTQAGKTYFYNDNTCILIYLVRP